MFFAGKIIGVLAVAGLAQASLSDIKNVFTFGDSYTTDGWNGSGDPLAPHLSECFTAGPPWSRQFADLLNATLINLANFGAVADQNFIFTRSLDFRGQATVFINQIADSDQVSWNSANSLFAVSFGTYDISISYRNSEGNGADLYAKVIQSYINTVERLYAAGARNFVFNNAVPFDRAQDAIIAGPTFQDKAKQSILEFNRQLQIQGSAFCASKSDLGICEVFDTHAVFTELMDNFAEFGFATPDDFCPSYSSLRSGCVVDPTIDPTCLGPIDVYIWKDGFHPSFASDRFWAEGLVEELS